MPLTDEEKQKIIAEYKDEEQQDPIKVHVVQSEGSGCVGCFVWIIAIMFIPATFGLSLLLPFLVRSR